MNVITATEAKSQLLSIIRKVSLFDESFLLTHKGEECAIVLSSREYTRALETINALKNKKLMKELLASIKDVKNGELLKMPK